MSYKKLPILLILSFTVFTRFYGLMHDAPYFFDPDERNMASAITRFRLPQKRTALVDCLKKELTGKGSLSQEIASNCTLNPQFFAYGQFPLYLAYASDQIHKSLSSFFPKSVFFFSEDPYTRTFPHATSFDHAIFWLRFYSAVASVLTILFLYTWTKILLGQRSALFAALIASAAPSLIQSAHFGTTESILTGCFVATMYYSTKIVTSIPSKTVAFYKNFMRSLFMMSVIIGIALGSKLTGIFLIVPAFLSVVLITISFSLKPKNRWLGYGYLLLGLFVLFCGILFFSVVSSPYSVINVTDFLSSVFGYEQAVATGTYKAFYTRQFEETLPVLFQLQKVFPFALGWPLYYLGSVGFVLLTIKLVISSLVDAVRKILVLLHRMRRRKRIELFPKSAWFIVLVSFLVYLVPNIFLYAKWTRFTTPILPFFALFAAYYVSKIASVLQTHSKRFHTLHMVPIFALCILCFLPGLAFMSIYFHDDTRITASRWIWDTLPDNSYVLSETANVVDIPVSFPNANVQRKKMDVISFDFYHLDESPSLFNELIGHLVKADYIFIPSRRIFANHLRFPHQYPLTAKYYSLLFSGKLGFEKVKEFSSFPSLFIGSAHIEFPDEGAEETFTVFDHPVIRIYKKTTEKTVQDYRTLFSNSPI